MSWSSDRRARSRPAAEQLLQLGAALAAAILAELREPGARLLDRHRDELAVLALLRPAELLLDIAQVELLLRHHALERLAVLAAIEHPEVGLELIEGEPLHRVDGGEGDDASQVCRHLLEQRAVAAELLWAVREEALDLRGHRLGLDAQAVDPVREDLGVPLLVAEVNLHRAMQVALGAHLAEEPLQ